MSLVTRRRAIYTGLAKYLPEAELLPILSYWEAHYAHKPSFALNEFLAEVSRRSSLKLQRASLYRELIAIMNGPSTALLSDPAEKLEAWRRGALAEEVNGPHAPARQTFEALAVALFAAVPATQLLAFRRLVASYSDQLSDDRAMRLQMRKWLEQGGELPRCTLEIAQLRALLNHLYIGLCEYFGPVQADQLLSQAVRQVEGMSLPLSPRKLL